MHAFVGIHPPAEPALDMLDPGFANLRPELPLNETHEEALQRLKWWQERRRRAEEAQAKEKALVEAALAKLPKDRTEQDWTIISYSPYGSGQRCGS